MKEKPQNNQESRTSESLVPTETARPEVDPAWFAVDLEANRLYPQMYFAKIVFLAEVVFAHPPSRWQDFLDAELSPAQHISIGRIMTAMHRGQSIDYIAGPIADTSMPEDYPILVTNDRFDSLWRETKGGVDHLARLLLNTLPLFDASLKVHPVTMDEVFGEEAYTVAVNKFRRIIGTICLVLRSQEFLTLAKAYRDSFNPKRNVGGKKSQSKYIRLEIQMLALEKTKAALPGLDEEVDDVWDMLLG